MLRILSPNPIHTDFGLLILRLGVGASMAIFHGWGKISGGPELWARVGGSMGAFGLGFLPEVWGFLAAFAEFGCSILLVLGVLTRPAAILLGFTMFVAVITHLGMPPESPRAGWSGASHALELLAVYVTIVLTGPGRFSLGRRW
jgi:putative oxidoreductase